MSSRSSDDQPELVTDEPGLDPVSGRPWGEETPGKQVASYSLLVVVFVAAAIYLIVDGPGDGRGWIALLVAPVAIVVYAVRAVRATREFR